MISKLALATIERTDLKPTLPGPKLSYGNHYRTQAPLPSPDFSATVQLLRFCSNFSDRVTLFNRVLQRLLIPPSSIQMTDWITKYLMEFIPTLDAHLVTISQNLTDFPYANFCASIMRAFITMVLKSKPADIELPSLMKNFGCGCVECGNLQRFFTDGNTTISIRKHLTTRTHLERELIKVRAFGITWVTIRAGSPHELQVRCPSPHR